MGGGRRCTSPEQARRQHLQRSSGTNSPGATGRDDCGAHPHRIPLAWEETTRCVRPNLELEVRRQVVSQAGGGGGVLIPRPAPRDTKNSARCRIADHSPSCAVVPKRRRPHEFVSVSPLHRDRCGADRRKRLALRPRKLTTRSSRGAHSRMKASAMLSAIAIIRLVQDSAC